MKSALIIFVRNPVTGKVKTRIAKELGDELALQVYKQLLKHTWTITEKLSIEKYIFYADYINNDDLWTLGGFNKQLQHGNDLGERMKTAFAYLFNKGFCKVVIIGSDCYELTSEIIEQAFDALDYTPVAIGPTFDGGYYLLGMNTLIPSVFDNKQWSTESVFDNTITDITAGGHTYTCLSTLSDVDNSEDCLRYPSLLSLSANPKS